VTLVLLLAVVSVHTQEPKPSPPRSRRRSCLISVKFVEWPGSLADKTSPWVIGVFAQKGKPFRNYQTNDPAWQK
jgi:hypothetical protein